MLVTMIVNGEEVSRDIEPRLLLVHFLRDDLGLTGTHWGCDTSNCGMCVATMDGVKLIQELVQPVGPRRRLVGRGTHPWVFLRVFRISRS